MLQPQPDLFPDNPWAVGIDRTHPHAVGLVRCLRNNGTGKLACDYAMGKHGILTNQGNGQVFANQGRMTYFDQTQAVNLGTADSELKPSAITLVVWAMATRDSLQVLAGRRYATAYEAPTSYGLSHRGGNVMWASKGSGGANEAYAESTALAVNTIQCWAATINNVEIKLYLNGILKATTAHSGEIPYTDNYPTYVGFYPFSTVYNWQGYIGQFRLYNRVLEAGLIRDIYLNPFDIYQSLDSWIVGYNLFKPWFATDNNFTWMNGCG